MSEIAPDTRMWRVTVALIAPAAERREATADGGERLASVSRLLPSAVAYPDLAVAVRGPEEWPGGRRVAPTGWEVLPFVADVDGAKDALRAAQRVEAYLDVVLDFLSFGLCAPILVGQVEILDITRPVSVDDERTAIVFGSSPFGTSIRGVDFDRSIRGTLFATLPHSVPAYSSRIAAAFRWFHKSLASEYLHDKFMSLWIALEILCDLSDVSIEAPYLARCGHLIATCPECGVSTSKEVRGRTIQQFLIERFSVNSDVAKKLWAMRQMMHGSIPFDSTKLTTLPQMVEELRAAVVLGIKDLAGIPSDAAPIVAPDRGLFGFPSIGVEVVRPISADDIRPLYSNITRASEGSLDDSTEAAPPSSER